ncbi:hypothetical protein IFM89_021194 [Coptis chinensis]|uniref:Uncharacterized protein n=1 Tax=Coptis chinensis TaxID=261450 RepID=A0A835HG68_9MAGN|nr:hypothetical protein IFM89_021194 [Coptis chinensis]
MSPCKGPKITRFFFGQTHVISSLLQLVMIISYNPFLQLFAFAMGSQLVWSLGRACLDVYVLRTKGALQHPLLIFAFAHGDWVADTNQAPKIAQNLPPNVETAQHIVADEVHAQKKKYTRQIPSQNLNAQHEEEDLVETLRITVPAGEQDATRDTRVVTHRDGFASIGARPSMLPQRLQQRLGPRLGAISTQSGPSILPRRLQGRLRPGSGPQDLSHNAHPSDEETLMSMLLKLTRENNQLRRNDDKRPREENSQQESSVPRESSPVLQRGQYRPARGNRRFDRSPGGSDSSEFGYNGSRNTRRRTNGGYQMVGDRSGSQQWARNHRTGALHNSVGGYARTRELNPRRVEANFRQHRQDSVEPGWSPERRNHTHRAGTNNVALGKQEQQQRDKDRKKHNKDVKTGVSQSQKQDGRPSKDLTLPELSVNLTELYDKFKGKFSKLFPMKLDTEGRRDKSKKCKYHNDFGHTLNDCYAFKKEISRMADGGQLKEYLKGTQKLAHVNLIEHDVIAVCHAQAAVCSSNRERKWSMKRKIQKLTLASLCKQLKRKNPTFNDSYQGMNPGNLGSIGGDHEDTGGDIIPTESEKSESEEETLDDLEIRDLEILALEKSDWRLPFIEYLNSGNLPIEKALSQKVKREA